METFFFFFFFFFLKDLGRSTDSHCRGERACVERDA